MMTIQEAIFEICKYIAIEPNSIISILKGVATKGYLTVGDAHQLLSYGISFSDSETIDIREMTRGRLRPTYQDLEKHLIALAEKWRKF